MKIKYFGFVPAVLCAAGLAFGQEPATHSQTPREKTESATTTTDKKTTHMKENVVVGKVKSYTAGDKLEVTTAKGKSRTFDLNSKNTNVTGAENVQVGETVKVVQKKENGQTTISIEPAASSSASRSSHHMKGSK